MIKWTLAFLILVSDMGFSQNQSIEVLEGEIFITFSPAASEVQKKALKSKYDLTLLKEFKNFPFKLYKTSKPDLFQVIAGLKLEKVVLKAEVNHTKSLYSSYSKINDPDFTFGNQWYLNNIKWREAISRFTGNAVIKVAVIDGGFNHVHEQLRGVVLEGLEYNFINNTKSSLDEDGHGSLVSGIIAAPVNDKVGIAGISPTARIIPLKVSGNVGGIRTTDSVISAIDYAISQNARIINLSLGSPGYNEMEKAALELCNQRGILVVCAAGNDGVNVDSSPRYPASYDLPNIISVGASDQSDQIFSISNFGLANVDLLAPGENIYGCSVHRSTRYFWDFRDSESNWNNADYRSVLQYRTHNGIKSFWTIDWNSGGAGNYTNERFGQISTFIYGIPTSPRLEVYMAGYLGGGDTIGVATRERNSDTEQPKGKINSEGPINFGESPWLVDLSGIDQTGWDGRLIFDLIPNSDLNVGWLAVGGVRLTGLDTWSSIYERMSGTSFAAPIVTGVAALIMSENPNLTHLQVKDLILNNARKLDHLAGKVKTGGILDAGKIFQSLYQITSDTSSSSINLGQPYSYRISASVNASSYGAAGLPKGLRLNSKTGLITGKPTATGSYIATLQAIKNKVVVADAAKTFIVNLLPSFSSPVRVSAKRNSNVNIKPKVAGSPAPSFSVVSGSLPPGLSLNASTAAITGKPTTAGSYAFTVRGSNSAGNTDRSTTIVVK